MRTVSRLAMLLTCWLLVTSLASAAVPQLINYQGRLTGADGTPIAGTFSVTFSLYNVPTGGFAIFQETKSITTKSDGLFSTLLGSTTQLTSFGDTNVYLGIKVGSDPELSPRTRITSVPFAYRVQTLTGAAGGSMKGDIVLDGNISATSLNSSATSTFQTGITVYKGISSSQTNTGEAVWAISSGTTVGGNYGVRAVALNSTSFNGGVYGQAHDANGSSNSAAIYGEAINDHGGTIWGGYFVGWTKVVGNFYASAKYFQIDDPLDPTNNTLEHACVESDEHKNVYDGVVTLDASGEASVTLPSWFDALNKDFRYQLTAIGAPGPNLHIAQKIAGNQFRIAGGAAGMEVSWMVTGVRKDPYALAHPVQVQRAKPEGQRGLYLNPKEYGVDEKLGVDYATGQTIGEARVVAEEQAKTADK